MLPLKGGGFQVECLVDNQVYRLPATRADICVGGVKMHVGRHVPARFDQQSAKYVFSGPSLVGRNEPVEAEDFLDGFGEAIEGTRPGVGLIAPKSAAHWDWLIAPVPESVRRST